MTTVSSAPETRPSDRPGHHLITLRVENRAGVLVRVAGLFSRRGFNIFSLAVAPTDDERFSRISIVVDAESAPLQQILSQIDKLINVVQISELHPSNAKEAELLLATVMKDEKSADQLSELVTRLGGSIVDSSATAATLMVAGDPGMLDDFESALARFGIVELQRTGRIALPKLGSASSPSVA